MAEFTLFDLLKMIRIAFYSYILKKSIFFF